jgi:hypothetical protein
MWNEQKQDEGVEAQKETCIQNLDHFGFTVGIVAEIEFTHIN